MRKISLSIFLGIAFFTSCKEQITIVTSENADAIEQFAADELRNYLTEIYPDQKFSVSNNQNEGKAIHLDVTDKIAEVPDNPEGYLIKSDGDDAYILSRGNTGLIYGVYGMLEKLGCGFFLSDEMLAEPKKDFDLSAWNFSNEPLIKERFVFNWHNFISGCTGWDKQHWLEWIDRSQKMGYNTVMVHAYHNNPMHTYEFNGIKKEVGYINTSAKGRDWGNIPVNDVRRLPGGEIFKAAEFGSEIAMVPDAQRVEVAQSKMAEVFSYANKRGVKVTFAFDMDMPVLFLQNTMVASIPEEDKFYVQNAELWIPRPDKPEGYRFYKSQIEGLLNSYKTLTGISLFRRGSSYFKEVKLDELPDEWQQEYVSYLNQYPYLKKLDKPEVMASYISAKLVRAYQQILKEMGREDIHLGTGSWNHYFVVPTAAFLPENISIMPIDWESRIDKSFMENGDILSDFASPECKNRVIPFIWAHHDDGRYVGRPFKPTEDLYTKLQQGECNSFGVFHWMNRPLDLFFKSMGRQVWRETVNEPLDKTCGIMAKHYFGNEALDIYFEEWMSSAPMFGRATLMNFFYRNMDDGVFDFDAAISACEKRIALLEEADVSQITAKQEEYLEYFKTLEQFIIDFSKTQAHFLKAEELLNAGNIEGAQQELQAGDPTLCVKTFSKLSQIAKQERGEMAYAYRFATKYIPDYLSFEQRTRLKPFLINIDSVVYEDLAQGNRINFTYHIDPAGKFWESLGEKEFDSPIIHLPETSALNDELSPYDEIFQYGLKISSRDTIPIQPVMRASAVKNKSDVWKGKYELQILVASENNEKVSFHIHVNGNEKTFTAVGKSIVSCVIEQKETGLMSLVLKPDGGNIIVCGVILSPV